MSDPNHNHNHNPNHNGHADNSLPSQPFTQQTQMQTPTVRVSISTQKRFSLYMIVCISSTKKQSPSAFQSASESHPPPVFKPLAERYQFGKFVAKKKKRRARKQSENASAKYEALLKKKRRNLKRVEAIDQTAADSNAMNLSPANAFGEVAGEQTSALMDEFFVDEMLEAIIDENELKVEAEETAQTQQFIAAIHAEMEIEKEEKMERIYNECKTQKIAEENTDNAPKPAKVTKEMVLDWAQSAMHSQRFAIAHKHELSWMLHRFINGETKSRIEVKGGKVYFHNTAEQRLWVKEAVKKTWSDVKGNRTKKKTKKKGKLNANAKRSKGKKKGNGNYRNKNKNRK